MYRSTYTHNRMKANVMWQNATVGKMCERYYDRSLPEWFPRYPLSIFMSCKFFVLDVSGTCDPEDVTPGLDYSIWSG